MNERTGEPVSEADSIVEAVREKLKQRASIGRIKYGTTMDRNDLSDLEWLKHTQEEMLDAAVYIEKLIQQEEGKTNSGQLAD